MIIQQHLNLFPGHLQVKRLKKPFTALYVNENILYFNEDTVQSFDGLDIL